MATKTQSQSSSGVIEFIILSFSNFHDINFIKGVDKASLWCYNKFRSIDWVWRSLVACLNGVQEAGGSNPLTQTIEKPLEIQRFRGFFAVQNAFFP